MDKTRVAVDRIAAFEDPGAPADAVLRLADGSECRVVRSDGRFAVWTSIVQSLQKKGTPIYTACDEASGALVDLLPVALRKIESVADAAEGDKLTVRLHMSPSAHYLVTSRPDYEALRAALLEARKSGQPLLLAVHPRDMTIVHARVPPPGLDLPVI